MRLRNTVVVVALVSVKQMYVQYSSEGKNFDGIRYRFLSGDTAEENAREIILIMKQVSSYSSFFVN